MKISVTPPYAAAYAVNKKKLLEEVWKALGSRRARVDRHDSEFCLAELSHDSATLDMSTCPKPPIGRSSICDITALRGRTETVGCALVILIDLSDQEKVKILTRSI